MIPFLELALMDNHRDLMICMAESDLSWQLSRAAIRASNADVQVSF